MSNARRKGTYYENKLIKDFKAAGCEAWRVPASGALGHNPNVKVPDRVRKYLIGDVCVNIGALDVPVEVKFRTSYKAYSTLVKVQTSQSKSTKQRIYYRDCIYYPSISAFIRSKEDDTKTTSTTVAQSILTKEVRSWLVHTNILFIKFKECKDWIILELI